MRISSLDGVRGIALLLVLVYHHALIPDFGWAGVDLFFVLSGYLITRILRASRASEVYWSRFYTKRVARIAPALLLLLLAVALTSHHLSWRGLAGYTFFLGNWVNCTQYSIGVLIILWSLAVEEHYYAVWPILVRKVGRKGLLVLLGATLVAEPLVRVAAASHFSADAMSYLTFFRLDGIAFGSLLALLSEDEVSERVLERVGGWAALLLCSCFVFLSIEMDGFSHTANSLLFNGFGYSCVAAACFFVVAWARSLQPGSIADRLLSFRPLTFIGEISYGMYLYHLFILGFTRKMLHVPTGPKGVSQLHRLLPLNLVLTIAIAAISYYLVELPAKHWGERAFLGRWTLAASEQELDSQDTLPT